MILTWLRRPGTGSTTWAATEKMLVAGYHFSFPSAGHVEKDGAGYRLVPVAWSAAL